MRDIQSLLNEWPYEPGQITVRKIRGRDGRDKLQLRLDLGLLQMEVEGRPDGKRPYGCDTVLSHVERLLDRYSARHGGADGFRIGEKVSRELREEALMNYHRYLSLFVLEDFEGVVRDTNANLRIFDLLRDHSRDPEERTALEQYRPYVTMMNTRARAQHAMGNDDYRRAMAIINSGLAAIRGFFVNHGHGELFRRSSEAAILRELRREVSEKLPKDPLRMMQRRLKKAVSAERYEEAARLRDQIERLKSERRSVPTQ